MRILIFIVALIVGTLCAFSAQAHKVRVFAYVEGETIIAETKFSSGRPCMDCLLLGLDADSGTQVMSGRTNATGFALLPAGDARAKAPGGLQLVLDGGEGHRGEWFVEAVEYGGGQPTAEPAQETSESQVESPAQNPAAQDKAAKQVALTEKEIRAIVSEVMDQKLAPFRKQLLNKDDKPDLRDIAGGLGWLVGIAGLLAYARRRPESSRD